MLKGIAHGNGIYSALSSFKKQIEMGWNLTFSHKCFKNCKLCALHVKMLPHWRWKIPKPALTPKGQCNPKQLFAGLGRLL